MLPTPPQNDWHEYFLSEASKPEYGAFDKFDSVPPSYLGDVEKFKEHVTSNPLETIIIIPGPDHSVRLLHNCTIDGDTNRVNGIFGTKQFSPLKQVAIGALVRPLSSNTTTRTDKVPSIPTVDDFMGCTSGAEVLALVGNGEDKLDELERTPQSFWIHPHLLAEYFTHRQTKIESIGDSFVATLEDMDNTSAMKLTEQYYQFLVYIWAVGNGHARTLVKLSDPPDDDKTDQLLETAQGKLTQERNPSNNGGNTHEDETMGGNEETPNQDNDGNFNQGDCSDNPSPRSHSPSRGSDQGRKHTGQRSQRRE